MPTFEAGRIMAKLFAALVFLLVLSGCGNVPKTEFEIVDKTSIRLADSRFAGVEPTIRARDVYCGRQELASWFGQEGVAQLFLTRADSGCVVNNTNTSEDELIQWFPWLTNGKITYGGEAVMVDAPLGPIWVRQFQRDDRNCFLFRHNFGTIYADNVDASLNLIVGYFCSRANMPIAEDGIRQFVSSVTIGNEAPPPSNPAQIKPRSDGII
jgi:hypothetical protein